jgi:hypothetical protein
MDVVLVDGQPVTAGATNAYSERPQRRGNRFGNFPRYKLLLAIITRWYHIIASTTLDLHRWR